jgi:hypothetical protein
LDILNLSVVRVPQSHFPVSAPHSQHDGIAAKAWRSNRSLDILLGNFNRRLKIFAIAILV